MVIKSRTIVNTMRPSPTHTLRQHGGYWYSMQRSSLLTATSTDRTQAAPDLVAIEEQTGKIESSYSAVSPAEPALQRRRPVFEDYVFYAERQRAYEKAADGGKQ